MKQQCKKCGFIGSDDDFIDPESVVKSTDEKTGALITDYTEKCPKCGGFDIDDVKSEIFKKQFTQGDI